MKTNSKKRWLRYVCTAFMLLMAAYVLSCCVTGWQLRQLVEQVHAEPINHALFAHVIPNEEDYREINCHIHASGNPESYTLDVSFPLTYITPGHAKARYYVSYESAGDVEVGVQELPMIIEMRWDGGWRIERATALEFPDHDYGVSFP